MHKLKEIYYRIANALKIGWRAIKNPTPLTLNYFTILSSLLELIMKVATDNKPLITHIAYIHPNEGEKNIVSIWAGVGVSADPINRIKELLEENSRLRLELSKHITDKGVSK